MGHLDHNQTHFVLHVCCASLTPDQPYSIINPIIRMVFVEVSLSLSLATMFSDDSRQSSIIAIDVDSPLPKYSMYGISTYFWDLLYRQMLVNITIHGASGLVN